MILGGKGSRAYFSFEVEDVDIARLQKAIKNLVEEQEALRCTFHARIVCLGGATEAWRGIKLLPNTICFEQ